MYRYIHLLFVSSQISFSNGPGGSNNKSRNPSNKHSYFTFLPFLLYITHSALLLCITHSAFLLCITHSALLLCITHSTLLLVASIDEFLIGNSRKQISIMAVISLLKNLFSLSVQLIYGVGIAVSLYWMSLYKIVQVDTQIWGLLIIMYLKRNRFVVRAFRWGGGEKNSMRRKKMSAWVFWLNAGFLFVCLLFLL